MERAVKVQFVDVAFADSGSPLVGEYALYITYGPAPFQCRNPSSSAVLHNVTFQNSSQSGIYAMYTVVFEEVTYYNSDIMTVQAFGHVELGSSGPINFGPDTTFNMTQSSFSSDTGTALELYVAKAYISNSTFNTGRTQRGLYAQYVTLTVESSTFSNFRVAGVSSNLTMINCTFSNLNTGSAISMDHVNYLKLHNSTVFNNHASSGGGISFVGILLMITGCTFKSNTATLKGGAIYASVYYLNNSIISLNNSFLNNSATDGGAIYLARTTHLT